MNLAARLVVWCHAHDIPAFLILQATSLAVAGAAFTRRLPKGLRLRFGFLVAMIVGAPAGAVALGILLRLPRFLASRGAVHLIADAWLAAYGALAGTVLAVELAARLTASGKGLSGRAARRSVRDALAPALGLLVAVGRLGCFVAGCDFGAPSDLPWAIAYPRGTPAFETHLRAGLVAGGDAFALPVHPTQLYEALVGLAACVAAEVVLRRGSAPRGTAFRAAIAIYAAGRLAVEALRGDARPMAGGLSVAAWLSIGLLALVVARMLGAAPGGRSREANGAV